MTNADDDFEAHVDKMTKIAEVLKKFDSAEVQARVYDTLAAKAFGTTAAQPVQQQPSIQLPDNSVDLDNPDELANPEAGVKKAAKKAGPKKSGKVSFVVPKDIDFAPAGKPSLTDFTNDKAPTTKPERALVAVYYLEKILERKVATGDVIAVFRTLGWDDPSDPDNNLQQAGRKHWLDTGDMKNIKVVWGGDSYVTNNLPKAKPKSAK